MAKITLTREAAKQLDSLPKPIQTRMHWLLGRLENWPEVSGAKPLTGSLAGDIGCALAVIGFSFTLKGMRSSLKK